MSESAPQPDISVVICTRNRADSLRQALETVVNQDTGGRFAYEVVVVDDASEDGTPDVVQQAIAAASVPVRHERRSAATGIAAARNNGVEAARGRAIVFFDDDQLAEPDWLARLFDIVEEHSAQCVGGGRKLDLAPEDLARLGPVCRIILGELLFDGPPAPLADKALPSTGNLLLDQAIFKKVGKFDENYAASGEDTDLILRARAAGFVIWSAPTAMVSHMIPEYRLHPEYFQWVSLRWGCQFAQLDRHRSGVARVLALATARLAQLVLVHLPQLAVAKLRGDAPAALDRRCLIWRAVGYIRATGAIAKVFPQRAYMEWLEFKREGELFGNHGSTDRRTGQRTASGV